MSRDHSAGSSTDVTPRDQHSLTVAQATQVGMDYITSSPDAPHISGAIHRRSHAELKLAEIAQDSHRRVYLRVRAATATASSGPSNEVIARLGGACQVPDGPTGLAAAVVAGQLTVQWTGAGGSFRLEAGSAVGRSDIFAGDVGSATTLSAAVPDGFHFLQVREQNACGVGPASSHIIARAGVPEAPGALAASVIGNAVTLRWTPPAGPPVDGYPLTAGSALESARLASGVIGAGWSHDG